MKKDLGGQSLLFSRPILWNSLNNKTGNILDIVHKFKLALKKCDLDQARFIKGTCVNLNKNSADFIYFKLY